MAFLIGTHFIQKRVICDLSGFLFPGVARECFVLSGLNYHLEMMIRPPGTSRITTQGITRTWTSDSCSWIGKAGCPTFDIGAIMSVLKGAELDLGPGRKTENGQKKNDWMLFFKALDFGINWFPSFILSALIGQKSFRPSGRDFEPIAGKGNGPDGFGFQADPDRAVQVLLADGQRKPIFSSRLKTSYCILPSE